MYLTRYYPETFLEAMTLFRSAKDTWLTSRMYRGNNKEINAMADQFWYNTAKTYLMFARYFKDNK